MSISVDGNKSKRELKKWGCGSKINEHSKLLPGKEVHTIACGGSHSAALLNDGTVYIWGDGRSGQLGLGNEIKRTDTPKKITALADERVVGLWCGFAQSAVFTASGTLYTWGFDCFCGPKYEPTVLKKYTSTEIRQVEFGPSMAMMLMVHKSQSTTETEVNSEVYVWGIADKGALGLGENVRQQRELTVIPQLSKKGVIKIAVGEFHAAAVTNRCEVFVWGLNEDETLGTLSSGIIWTPRQVVRLESVQVNNIICGTNCTFAVSSKGKIYSWGKGRHGVLGHGNEEDKKYPVKIESLRSVVGLASGGMHLVAWMEDGSVASWGWGRDYKLGHFHDKDLFEPTPVEGTKGKIVLQVACGFDRTLALLETDLVTVTYNQDVKTIAIYAETTVSDIITRLSDHLQIQDSMVLIDMNGQELPMDGKMRICAKSSHKFFLIQRPSLWDDAGEDLIFTEETPTENPEKKTPLVAKASIDKLIFWLTHHTATGQQFRDLFLLTYPNFLEPQKFLEKLIERYNRPRLPHFLHESSATRRIIQLRVVNVLRKWILGSYLDVMNERDIRLIEAIRIFIETDIQTEQPREAVFLRRFLTSKLGSGGNISQNSPNSICVTQDAPASYPPDLNEEMGLFKYPAAEFARQLTIIEYFYFFIKIHPNEFVNLAWTKENKEELAPNIISCIMRFNNLSNWFAAEILRGATHELRVKRTERIIDIAMECLKLRNLTVVAAVCSTLGSASIYRLKVWNQEIGISVQHRTRYNTLKQLTSMEGNMAEYRDYFDSLPTPKIPFLGISLQDLCFLHDANPNHDPDHPKLINFTKWRKLGKIIEKIVEIQKTPYNLRPIQSLLNYLLSARGFDNHENSSYKYSKLIEPPNTENTSMATIVDVPSYLPETVSGLYVNDPPKRPLLEEPEIQLLNQRAQLILKNFQPSMESDRFQFWKYLVEKLAASSSRRLIVSRYNSLADFKTATTFEVDCLSFREVLVKSCVIEYSLESVLISFPKEPSCIELFLSLLRATLRPYINFHKIISIFQELSACRLVKESRKVLVDVISCYKDNQVQARHNRISASVRALSRLHSKQLNVSPDAKPIDKFMEELYHCAEIIQYTYTQQQLLREKRLEYDAVFKKYDEPAFQQLCEFLVDSRRNIHLRISHKQEEKQEKLNHYHARISGLKQHKEEEELLLATLEDEERDLLAQLETLEKKIEQTHKKVKSYDFFLENSSARAMAEKSINLEGIIASSVNSEVCQSLCVTFTYLSDFVPKYNSEVAARKNSVAIEYHSTSENLQNFIRELQEHQESWNEYVSEMKEDKSRMSFIHNDFMLRCDYRAKIIQFAHHLIFLIEFNPKAKRAIYQLLDVQRKSQSLINN